MFILYDLRNYKCAHDLFMKGEQMYYILWNKNTYILIQKYNNIIIMRNL